MPGEPDKMLQQMTAAELRAMHEILSAYTARCYGESGELPLACTADFEMEHGYVSVSLKWRREDGALAGWDVTG